MKRLPTIDWNQVMLDLSSRGYTVRVIAVEIDIPRSTLNDLKNIPNTEPRYSNGRNLVDLWCEVTGKSESDLPANLLA